MEQFLTYFPSAFSWGNLAVLILGSAGGLFFGAMPGLSPTMAVALLVPFTFYLPADTSLILLGAVYTSAVAGGSISAILLSIPGAPSSIATLFDGYPMAKQGRAQEALYTVFVSSLIGGVFGVLVMILFSPPMAEFAMRFGPSELFWTAIFGTRAGEPGPWRSGHTRSGPKPPPGPCSKGCSAARSACCCRL